VQSANTEEMKYIAIILTILSGLFTTNSIAQDSLKAQQYHKEAEAFLADNNRKMAIISLEKAVECDTTFNQGYVELARLYSFEKEYGVAKKMCYQALSIKNDQRDPHLYLASIYGMEESLDSSYIHYEAISRIDENDADAFLGMAQVRTMQEDYDAAMIYAKKAVQLTESSQSPNTGKAQYLRGVLHYYLGEDKQAVKYLITASKNGVELEDHLLEFIMEYDQKVINFESEADFGRTEHTLVKHYEFILNNPAEEGTTDRLNSCQYILDWVSTCPYITVQVTQKLVPYMTYGESLIVFMGGWAKYCIEGSDCSEKWKG
jgi:tetratricopeptide (TPR) repeat protein